MNYHLIIKLYENSGKLLEIEFTSLKCFDYIIYNDSILLNRNCYLNEKDKGV